MAKPRSSTTVLQIMEVIARANKGAPGRSIGRWNIVSPCTGIRQSRSPTHCEDFNISLRLG